MKSINYSDLKSLSRQKQRISELICLLDDVFEQVSPLVGERIVFESLVPLKTKLVNNYLKISAEYRTAFDKYFKTESKRICP